MAEAPVTFGAVLRKLRVSVQLTQEELARAAKLSVRAVSDLERGVVAVPHRDTVRLLELQQRVLAGLAARAELEALAALLERR